MAKIKIEKENLKKQIYPELSEIPEITEEQALVVAMLIYDMIKEERNTI